MHEKKLMDEAMEELRGAKCYIKCAMKYRESEPQMSKKYYEMAQDELRHADILYHMAEEVGSKMQHTDLEAAYADDQKSEYAEKCANVKTMLDMYRGA